MAPFLVVRICYEISGKRHCVLVDLREAKSARDRVHAAGGVVYWTQVME